MEVIKTPKVGSFDSWNCRTKKKTVQKTCHFHFTSLYLKLSCVRLYFYCEKLTGRNGSNDMLQRCWQIQCVDSSSSVRWAIDYLPRLIFWKRGITLDLSVAESLESVTASPNLVPKWEFICHVLPELSMLIRFTFSQSMGETKTNYWCAAYCIIHVINEKTIGLYTLFPSVHVIIWL